MPSKIRLLETIRFEPRGACLLDLHEARMLRSLRDLYPESLLLSRLEGEGIRGLLKSYLGTDDPVVEDVYKLRMVYTPEEVEGISLEPYRKRLYDRIRLVPLPPNKSYTYKYADRHWLEALDETGELSLFLQGDRLTDTHISNVLIFRDGQWLTPRRPLLKGVMREHLLQQGLIEEADLRTRDLKEGVIIRIINAMIPLDESPQMEVIRAEGDTLDVFISLK